MTFLSRLLSLTKDPAEQIRPLWHGVVALAREPHWYRAGGVADSVAGRFDMVCAVQALVLLRMERDATLAPLAHHLTELFVEDMDGQLRELGVGDLMVGKHIGKLMAALGGRLGALRRLAEAGDWGLGEGAAGGALGGDLGEADSATRLRDTPALAEAVVRNFTLVEGADPAVLGASLRALGERLAATSAEELLAGRVAP